jgi:hypothetical protein
MQEEILIKRYRSGTTIHFFNTDINPNNYETSTVPSVVKLSSVGNVPMELYAFDGSFLTGNNPIDIHSFDGVYLTGNQTTVLWKRNEQQNWHNSEVRMNYVQDVFFPNSNYVSGRTFSQTINLPIENISISAIGNRFIEKMNEKFTAGTTTFVFAEPILIDDLYANVKLERTYDVLNTLSIYNKVSGEYPTRESNTGVVFGKLEAIQKITDANGNKIRIPLRNVPIGIFTASDDFQTPTDLDNDGNRIRLNYRPLTETQDTYPTHYISSYFNEESAEFDNTFLISTPLSGLNIHQTFSNVVYTNENGEFFLHDIEVGPQILFFEVDLLKQGLTKDEVALNFFPYPPNYDNISIDTLPHYFYRAMPIDVVPSWGTSYQTGYTELNISVNLDLRKWATYIIPPVTYKGNPMDSAVYYDNYSRAPLTVQVRDMSKFNKDKLLESSPQERLEAYPSKGIQMVEVSNILDKNDNQQWEWSNEFSQIKDRALFFTYGFHAIKLPANIYDDESFKTDKYGEEQDSPYLKGVWLCGYQIKTFLTKEDEFYRTTGLALTSLSGGNKSWFDRDHFHCSLYQPIDALKIQGLPNSYAAKAEGVGLFPYEKAWTKNYPEKYNIPKPPKTQRYNNFYTEHEFMESPEFLDGEYIYGGSWLNDGEGWNGHGLSWFSMTEQYTDFATDIIGGQPFSKMYKYERIGAEPYGVNQYFGCYGNGYTEGLGGVYSNVDNGERYQRIEAGYGYFLFPSSMPRIVPTPSGLFGYLPSEVETSDAFLNYQNNQTKGFLTASQITMSGWWNLIAQTDHYSSYSVLRRGKSISMDLSKKLNENSLINDRLNIYRIIDSKSRVPYGLQQPVVPTYTKFIVEKMFFTNPQNGERMDIENSNPTAIGDNGWDGSYYRTWSDRFVQTNSLSQPNSYVWLDIENSGDVKMKLEISDANTPTQIYNLEPGEKIRYHHGINSGINDIHSSFDNFTIIAGGNFDYDEVNNKYLKTKIKFTTSADWNGYSSGQRVINLHIRKDCANEISTFDALDSVGSSNTWYADTVWKGIRIDYYRRDGNTGYPASNNRQNWDYGNDGPYANIQGMFYNPGNYSNMYELPDGGTYSSGVEEVNRLDNGGSIAFYWTKIARGNPSGQYNFTPLMSIGSANNFADSDTFWNTSACAMKF